MRLPTAEPIGENSSAVELHLRQNVIGVVAPQIGALFSLIVEGVDTDVFQFFLDDLAKAVPQQSKRQILILDNASWHRAARVNCYHFEPKFLPGYSPDFNPIERLWLWLKADWFWDFIAHTPDELTDRLAAASKVSSISPPKPLPSALSGNDLRHSL